MIHQLIIAEHLYGTITVEAPNRSKALEKGLVKAGDGEVEWKNTYEKVYFAEDKKPEFSPEYVWRLAMEHSYFRKMIIDLQGYVESVIDKRPNIMDRSDDPKADYKDLGWLMLNLKRITTKKTLDKDYTPDYDSVAELVGLLKVMCQYNSPEKGHYDKAGEEDKVNHIWTYITRAIELVKNLESDEGEFILLETIGGCSFVNAIKDKDGNPRCFTSRGEAVSHGKQLQAPKVIRIR